MKGGCWIENVIGRSPDVRRYPYHQKGQEPAIYHELFHKVLIMFDFTEVSY
jgi:hypothetical protein